MSGVAQRALYVSIDGNDSNPGTIDQPYQSIQKAIVESGRLKSSFIYLKAGIYPLTEPLVVLPTSQLDSLKITGYSDDKVVISGGRRLTGWKKQKNGLWVTDVPEAKNGKWQFSQLFVNGKLQPRARKPNSGFLRVKGMPDGTALKVRYNTPSKTFEFAEGEIRSDWKNMEDVEVVVYHFWTDTHLRIQSVDTATNIITFKHRSSKVFSDDYSNEGARYIVQNVFEELDSPGEWYLDRKSGKCFYYPFPEDDIEVTTIVAPVADQLIRLDGDPLNRNFIKKISFENLEFCYTNWELPIDDTNSRQGSAIVPAAISLKGAQNCSFKNCRFTNLGTWAVELNEGCSKNTFVLNEIDHVAAGGIRINGGNYDEHPLLSTSKNKIERNHIHHYGEVYPSAVGVLLQRTEGNQIAHNLIHNGYYTGISIGWEWGYGRSVSRDNIIEYNHIHHIGQGMLSDMGAIYTLGVSPGTIIRNNLIHDVDANGYGGWGVFLDEGSTHILFENNVIYNTKFAPLSIHFSKELTVRNNIFALGRKQQLDRSRVEHHKSVFFERNIVYWREGNLIDGKWKDEPYQFYFHPKNETGTATVKETFDMDYNLFFNPVKSLDQISFNGKSWREWNEMGKDVHSVYADPLFEDATNYDFRLKAQSPAFNLGFTPIDISGAGFGTDKPGPRR